MKIKLGNLKRGYTGFWCWLMGPGSVVGTMGYSEAESTQEGWCNIGNQQPALVHLASP